MGHDRRRPDAEFTSLAKALRIPEIASDLASPVAARKEHEAALDAAIADAAGARWRTVERELQAAGVKACRVVKSYLLPDDENQHMGFFQEPTREITGTHWQKTWPFRFSGIDASHGRPAPA
jgi:crotonobetainyl-CoA:carnitine CoA-transferase CaiB-like acyl-CoA transferase